MRRLFGTNGIRGIVNQDITPEFALKIGASIGTFFNSGNLIVGRDGRSSGLMLMNAIISGITSAGVGVIDIGLAPTPAIQYGVGRIDACGAVVITASHNPPEFNGIKVAGDDGIELPRKDEEVIEEIYFNETYRRTPWNELGSIQKDESLLDIFIEGVVEKANADIIKKANLKVVVDPGNGVGALVTPYLLRKLGCNVITINAQVDGNFPGRKPEPTPESLTDLAKTVKALGADLGVAHDGDADRVIFVDEKGVIHWGDVSFALIVRKILQEKLGKIIVTPVASSKLIEDVTNQYGGRLVLTEVGSIVVARKLQELNGICGGEENGGIFYAPHQFVRDGAMGATLMVELIAEERKTLSQLVDELPKYYSFKLKTKCPNNLKDDVMEKIKKEMAKYEPITIDGVKIVLEKGWVLIRPSGTEPLIRCFAETSDEQSAKDLAGWGLNLVEEAIGTSDL
ncbi:MAG: phosphoglucosamine mutase [Promethearchaeota archaeon]